MHKLYSLKAWTCARDVACRVYRLTLRAPLNRHFGLADQLRRSAISIPANIAEGYGLSTRLQLIRCLRIALGSAYELRCHLEIAHRVGLTKPDDYQAALPDCDMVIRLLIGLLKKFHASVPRS
jgi:four helix bundle protein